MRGRMAGARTPWALNDIRCGAGLQACGIRDARLKGSRHVEGEGAVNLAYQPARTASHSPVPSATPTPTIARMLLVKYG
jgi:hypothetical protein